MKYKFSHRANGKYYWTRRLENGFEEQVTCAVLWFWNWLSDDTTLPACDDTCEKRGIWGATGMMPDHRHVLVSTPSKRYLAHVPDCNSRGPRIGEDGQPVCRRSKGHHGRHQADPEDGWGSNSTWGLRMKNGKFL